MSAPNICDNDGHLVAARWDVPTDPSDYSWAARDPVVGCNHLRCSACGKDVRQRAGYFITVTIPAAGTPEWKQWVSALYDRADWNGISHIGSDPGQRVYACRCGAVTESFVTGLSLTGLDGAPAKRIPWSCQGHPVARLPIVLNGQQVDASDLVSLVQRTLSGWAPAGAEHVPGGWTRSLLLRLRGTDAESRVLESARAALIGSDDDARVGALDLFAWVPDVEVNRLLLQIARTNDRSPFRGAKARGRDLERELLKLVAERWRLGIYEGNEIRNWLRGESLKAGAGAGVVSSLAQHDPKWVYDNSEALVRANPETAISILKTLFDAWAYTGFDIEGLARKLAAVPGVSKAVLRDEVERTFFGEARSRVLAGIGESPLS